MVWKVIRICVILILIIFSILLIKTAQFHSKQNKSVKSSPPPKVKTSSLEHFQNVIRFKTISYADTALFDSAQFLGLHRYLENAYPQVHKNMQREVINKYTLMYRWKGRSDTSRPVIFLAHLDIVPVEKEALSLWEVEPFAGVLKDGFVWGRGSFDNKVNLVSLMETAEKLLQEGFQPARDIYFIFGHDEEVNSPNGGGEAARILAKRNIRAHLVLDEGGIVTKEKVPGVQFQLALLGTVEKGYLSASLQVRKEGGHSSMPEKETAIDILAKTLVKLHDNPFEGKVTLAQENFIDHVGPELPFFKKLIFANAWLFKSLIIKQYEKTPVGNAVMHTTYAPTMLNAGIKDNIIPASASAVVNLRLLPGDSAHLVIERLREIVNDKRVTISAIASNEASSVTPVESVGYKKVETAVLKTFPNTVVTPFLLVGGTDSKKFQSISDHIIRFTPLIDPIGNHGVNERVSVESFGLAMWYYEWLIREL